PEVDLAYTRVPVTLEPSVQRRVLTQRDDCRARDESKPRHTELTPCRLDAAHVRFDPGGARRGRVERALHVLADLPAHARKALARGGYRRGGHRLIRSVWALDVQRRLGFSRNRAPSVPVALHYRQHVLLAHAAPAAGARDRVEVDPVLGGDPLHDRGV